jgi:hydrophobe/amphiphile efflux-3 (HAE3) family protein
VQRLAGIVTRHAAWVLAAVAAVTLLAASRIVDFRTGALLLGVDPSVDDMLPQGDEGRLYYDHVRRLFGSDETLVVALADDDVFTAENLRRIQELTRRLQELEGVHHVVSLANALNIRSRGEDLAIEPFIEAVPDDPAELARIRREALDNPIYAGNLVSRDGRATVLVVHLMDLPERELLEQNLDRQILRAARAAAGDASIWITGGLYLKAETGRMLLRDLGRTVPLAIAVAALVALVAFRTVSGVVIPLATLGIALVWTLGAIAAMGRSLNLVTVVIPPLVLVVGFAYAVHVLSEYYEVLGESAGEAPPEPGPAGVALSRVALPVLLTAVTTAAGLLSLTTSPLGAIVQFGLLSTLGVAAALVASLTFAPAILQLLPPRRRRRSTGGGAIDRMAGRLARLAVRRRAAILLTGAVVAAVALSGMSRIRVGSDFVRNFDPDSVVRRDIEAVNEHLEGSNLFYVVLHSEVRDAFKEPATLREVQRLQAWLEAQPEIGGTTSLVDYVRLINRGFHGDDPAHLAIPASRRLTTQLLFFGANDELESYVDSRYQTAGIRVRSRIEESGAMAALVRRIEEHLAGLPSGLSGRVTGNSVLVARTIDDIAQGQAASLSLAFAAILGVLSLLFTSLRVGIFALVPNVLPVLVYFGVLGWSGVTLNPTTGLVACLVLGIAVDDTIHFMTRFNESARRLADEVEGVAEALRSVGRPVTYTSAALCLGFLVLTTSELRNQVEFGALAAFTLAVAWLLDITFTPALCARMRIVTLWDVVSLDLGEDPQRSIPLFEGLKKTQARIAALMASIRRFPAGHRIFSAGDEGDEMYVVIDGRLAVSLQTERGRVHFNTLERGDVVGEVALFHGARTADVEAVTDVRLLRLTDWDLERIRRRYPRTGAQLYRNLSRILADRVASTTAKVR